MSNSTAEKTTEKKQASKGNLWGLLLILSLPYLTVSLNINGFLALLPFVREEFALTRTQVGYYSTFLFMSAAVLAIFMGSIVDRLGVKKGMLIGSLGMGFVMVLYGLAPSYGVLLLLSLVAGLAFSIITPSVNKGVIIEAPPQKRAFSMGIMQAGLGVGGFAGASLLPLLGGNLGWRGAIQLAALFAVITAFFVFKLYREQSADESADTEEAMPTTPRPASLKESLSSFLKNRQLMSICLLGLLFGASASPVITHFTVFLTEDIELSRATAGLGFGTFLVGGIIGRPAWGWFSDRVFGGKREQTLFAVGLTIALLYLVFGLFLSSPQANVVLLFVVSFFLGLSADGWLGVHFTAVGEHAGGNRAGTATGLALIFTRAGIMAAPPIFGFVADIYGKYEYSWLLFSIIAFIASFLFYFLHQPRRKP